MTEEELDDPKNIKCKCGRDIHPCLIIVNKEWICAGCVEEKVNDLIKQLKNLRDNDEEFLFTLYDRKNNELSRKELLRLIVTQCKEISFLKKENHRILKMMGSIQASYI